MLLLFLFSLCVQTSGVPMVLKPQMMLKPQRVLKPQRNLTIKNMLEELADADPSKVQDLLGMLQSMMDGAQDAMEQLKLNLENTENAHNIAADNHAAAVQVHKNSQVALDDARIVKEEAEEKYLVAEGTTNDAQVAVAAALEELQVAAQAHDDALNLFNTEIPRLEHEISILQAMIALHGSLNKVCDLNPGATCKTGYSPLTSSWQDCETEAKNLGFTGDSVGYTSYEYGWGSNRPQGCFQSNGNNRFHFNKGNGGNFEGTDKILCCKSVHTSYEHQVGVASLSSQYGNIATFGPSSCLDGNSGTMCHTLEENNAFFMMEYPTPVMVAEVRIQARDSVWAKRVKDVVVYVTDTPPTKGSIPSGTQIGSTFVGPAGAGQWISFKSANAIIGKYVVVQQQYYGYINFAEVEVNQGQVGVASLSSQYGNIATYGPSSCLDGNPGTMCHSLDENNAFFMMEYSTPVMVAEVNLQARNDGWAKRVKDVHVYVTDTAPTKGSIPSGTQIGSTFVGPASAGQWINFKSANAIIGKYVVVQQQYKDFLNFAEVKVKQGFMPVVGVASLSSQYGNIATFGPSSCLDGNSGTMCHTLEENNAFFMMEYPTPILVAEVRLQARDSVWAKRVKDVVVYVTDTPPTKGSIPSGTQIGSTFVGPAGAGQWITFKSANAIIGKYVVVQQQYYGYINFAEVQVHQA